MGALVCLACVLAACSGGDDEASTAPSSTDPAPDASTDSTADQATESAADSSTSSSTTTTDAGDDAPPAEPAIVTALETSDSADPDSWSGSPTTAAFLRPRYASGETDPAAAAYAYLAEFAEAYGIADVESRFETASLTETAAGTIVRLDQSLSGTPVFAGQVAIAVDAAGTVTRVSGVIVPDRDTDFPAPAISADQAAEVAATATDLTPTDTDAPSLVVYSPAVEDLDSAPSVQAWRVVVADAIGLETEVLVDAADGTVLLVAGLDATEDWDVYDNANRVDEEGVSKLGEADIMFETRGGTTTAQVDNPHPDADAVAGHFSTTWNYFLDTHGRDSFDDAGGLCRLYVRVGVNWNNASANRDCTIRFGDGNTYAQELDISAHEFTHAITRSTADLVYEDESGALNEHYSDFFAAMVETSDWTIAPIARQMDRQSHISGYVITDSDNGGVHSNSRIGNTVGALVGSDALLANNDVWVQGIGRPKAAQIWYATLLGLGPRTGYYAWACATINTARDMMGSALIETDVESVIQAMVSVGLVFIIDDELSCDEGTIGSSTPNIPDDQPFDTDPDAPSPTDPPATTVPPDPTPTTTLPTGCDLVGQWRLRDQEFFDQIAELSGSPSGITYEGGDYYFDFFEDGTAYGYRDAWSFRVSSPQGDLITEITSTDPGTWSADDTTLTLDLESGEALVSLYIDTGGSLVPLPIGDQVVPPQEALGGTATYECVGDVLYTVEQSMGLSATFDRVG